MNLFGAVLKDLRQYRGFSLRKVAKRAEISATHLCVIERGDSIPSLDVLNRLWAVLGGRKDKLRNAATYSRLERKSVVEIGDAVDEARRVLKYAPAVLAAMKGEE